MVRYRNISFLRGTRIRAWFVGTLDVHIVMRSDLVCVCVCQDTWTGSRGDKGTDEH